ncbi:MAG: DUF4286 family protein [Saprospiraceae bacterium]|nr:DUF4286 family protein [Saprospiraceae bacterium]
MKLLYNVTIKVEAPYHEDWLKWMKQTHIPDVMATGHFESYRLTRLLGDEDEYGIGYAVQYLAHNHDAFNDYEQHHAKRLQKDHQDRYAGKYVAFRTIMEVLDEGGV